MDKAETLKDAVRRTAERKTQDKGEGNMEGCDFHPLISLISHLSLSFARLLIDKSCAMTTERLHVCNTYYNNMQPVGQFVLILSCLAA